MVNALPQDTLHNPILSRKRQRGIIIVPLMLLLSAVSLYATHLLLQTVLQQRIVHNYLHSAKVEHEMDSDLQRLISTQALQHSMLIEKERVYIPDDPRPICTTGTWIYRYEVVNRSQPSYTALVILKQRVDLALGWFDRLNMLAVQFN